MTAHTVERGGAASRARTGAAHVVLPAFNEEGSLPPLLVRLAAMSAAWGTTVTVWVVDDGLDLSVDRVVDSHVVSWFASVTFVTSWLSVASSVPTKDR